MSRRAGNPFVKYVSLMLLAYGLGDMIVGLATKTQQPVLDVTLVFLAGYMFFTSKFARGMSQSFLIMGVALIVILTSSFH